MSQGSTSKVLTAWRVMQLVEAGRVDLDAPVQQYISWRLPTGAFSGQGVTVRRLLSHTGGVACHGYTGLIGALPDTRTALDAQREDCCMPPGSWAPGDGATRVVTEPGSAFSYSGTCPALSLAPPPLWPDTDSQSTIKNHLEWC